MLKVKYINNSIIKVSNLSTFEVKSEEIIINIKYAKNKIDSKKPMNIGIFKSNLLIMNLADV